MKSTILLITLLFNQIYHPVHWSYAAKKTGKNEATLFLKAEIEGNWHVYSAYQAEGGPVKTSFIFAPSKAYELAGGISEPMPVSKYEDSFKMKVSYFEHEVIFQQKVTLHESKAIVSGTLKYMCCNDQQCLPPETVSFNIPVK